MTVSVQFVVTQDADVAGNINFNRQFVQNGTKFGVIVARIKQIPEIRINPLFYILIFAKKIERKLQNIT